MPVKPIFRTKMYKIVTLRAFGAMFSAEFKYFLTIDKFKAFHGILQTQLFHRNHQN